MEHPEKAAHNARSDEAVLTLSDWLTRQASQEMLRFITCGSVDDGKSSLVGRLLWESKQIFDDQLSALAADSRRHGTQGDQIDLALLVDGLAAEREQGITIDVAYRFFSTPRRRFIVADTPGHDQYTRNMVTAASTAHVAVILVDARHGILPQTRRHARLASLLGIRHVALAINKMDLVSFDANVFNDIQDEFLTLANTLQFENVTAIPLSALRGDNVTARSAHTSWYSGPTLMGYLESVEVTKAAEQRFVFPVQWVNRPHADFRGFSGTVASGCIAVGDTLRVTASGRTAQVKRIVTFDADLSEAKAGDAITLVLNKEVDASRGDILATAPSPLEMSGQCEAIVVWMHEDAGQPGRNYDVKLANQWTGASITRIEYRVNVNTETHEPAQQLNLNDIAVCSLAFSRPVTLDTYQTSRTLGSFILVDRFSHATVAAGLIRQNLSRAPDVHRHAFSVSRRDREMQNGHTGKVIWFTGLSGSGKSTLANALEQELHTQGKRTYLLDGDNIRHGLNKDLGFTDSDRAENIRRVAEVAKLMLDAGLIVMVAFISPFRAERRLAQQLIGKESFVEVHINTPLAVCEQRDPKGLYKKARSGLLPNMTGIDSPYEPPEHPSLRIDTSKSSVSEIVTLLCEAARA